MLKINIGGSLIHEPNRHSLNINKTTLIYFCFDMVGRKEVRKEINSHYKPACLPACVPACLRACVGQKSTKREESRQQQQQQQRCLTSPYPAGWPACAYPSPLGRTLPPLRSGQSRGRTSPSARCRRSGDSGSTGAGRLAARTPPASSGSPPGCPPTGSRRWSWNTHTHTHINMNNTHTRIDAHKDAYKSSLHEYKHTHTYIYIYRRLQIIINMNTNTHTSTNHH